MRCWPTLSLTLAHTHTLRPSSRGRSVFDNYTTDKYTLHTHTHTQTHPENVYVYINDFGIIIMGKMNKKQRPGNSARRTWRRRVRRLLCHASRLARARTRVVVHIHNILRCKRCSTVTFGNFYYYFFLHNIILYPQ